MKKISSLLVGAIVVQVAFALLLVPPAAVGDEWTPTEQLSLEGYSGDFGTFGDHVAVAFSNEGMGQLWFVESTDGGETWSQPPEKLVEWENVTYMPCTVIDDNGTHVIFTVSNSTPRMGAIFYMNRPSGSSTWSGPLRITDILWDEFYEGCRILSSNGKLYVMAYHAGGALKDIIFTMSADGGQTWTPDEMAEKNLALIDQPPISFCVHKGTLFFTYHVNEGGEWLVKIRSTSDDGLTWGTPNDVVRDGYAPRIASDGTNMYLTYLGTGDGHWYLNSTTSTDDGLTWGRDRHIDDVPNNEGNEIYDLEAHQSSVHVVLSNVTDSGSDVWYWSSDDGADTWDGRVTISKASAYALAPWLSIPEQGGRIHAVWGEFDGSFQEAGMSHYYLDLTPSSVPDADGDGYPDSADAFPNDATQWNDTDGDGYGDNASGTNADAFPNDATQWNDSDGDGYGDNSTGNDPDAFPDDPDEWNDTDADGVGDNADAFPNDAGETTDTDGDGTGDNADGDDDGDGLPDDWELSNGLDPLDPADAAKDDDGDGITNLDEYLAGTDPGDAGSKPTDSTLLIVLAVAIVGGIAAAGAAAYLLKKRPPRASPSSGPDTTSEP